jgi:hypothetical protein
MSGSYRAMLLTTEAGTNGADVVMVNTLRDLRLAARMSLGAAAE